MQARRAFRKKIGEEQPLFHHGDAPANVCEAICWSYGRTLDNIAVISPSLRGYFSAGAGADAILPCEFVNAGKYRNGAERWWCRVHQTHWGTKADQLSYSRSRAMICANHEQHMQYVVAPLEVDVEDYREVGIWCLLPPAMSSMPIENRPPRIQVTLSGILPTAGPVQREVDAMAIVYRAESKLFSNDEITRVNITPPAAFEFVCAVEYGRELSCVGCSHCRYPHLDLGDFARKPHRKHSCANCGRDSTWTKAPIVSTPLKPLFDRLARNTETELSDRSLNLDDFPQCDYELWATTPAIVWTPNRPQTVGIRVRVIDDGRTVLDDTFGEVIARGKRLDRNELFQSMTARTAV